MRSAWMVLVLAAGACGGGGGGSDKLVFVTASEFDGGFAAGQPSTIDGTSLADTQCQTAAEGAGHDGVFVAWLSRSATGSLPQRNAIDVVSGDGPWRDVHGDMVFLNHSALANSPQNSIQFDQYGDSQFGPVWTGTQVGGTLDGTNDCAGWHSAEFTIEGTVGQGGSSGQWTDGSTFGCDLSAHLYCFEL